RARPRRPRRVAGGRLRGPQGCPAGLAQARPAEAGVDAAAGRALAALSERRELVPVAEPDDEGRPRVGVDAGELEHNTTHVVIRVTGGGLGPALASPLP